MQKTNDQCYELVKDLKTKKEFNQEIKNRFKEYDELIDEDTIALMIADELGRNKQVITKIIDIQPGTDSTVIGKITKITEPRNFKRKNGSSGRVLNLEITDETGSCGLVLWNQDVELVKQIEEGTTVKIINGYTKDGYSGIEINLGRWGLLEIEPADKPDQVISEPEENKFNEISGILIAKEPTRAFFKDNGEFGFVANIKIKDKDQEKKLTIWGEKVKEIQQFKVGETIKITDTNIKESNGKTEIHVNGKSNIQRG